MEKLNYRLAAKRETIEDLVSGDINKEEMEKYYTINIKNFEIYKLRDVSTKYVLDSIDNPDVLFVRNVE
jgi:hypothetical protein